MSGMTTELFVAQNFECIGGTFWRKGLAAMLGCFGFICLYDQSIDLTFFYFVTS